MSRCARQFACLASAGSPPGLHHHFYSFINILVSIYRHALLLSHLPCRHAILIDDCRPKHEFVITATIKEYYTPAIMSRGYVTNDHFSKWRVARLRDDACGR